MPPPVYGHALHLKYFPLLLVRLPSIKVDDFDADTVSSEIILRNLPQPGCLQFRYGSVYAANAFELKIAAINRTSRTYLQDFTVSGRLLKLNLRLLNRTEGSSVHLKSATYRI